MEHIAWMAWTLPTAIFFVMLASTLGVMTWLAVAFTGSLAAAFAQGAAPFILIDLVKAAAAAMILPQVWKVAGRSKPLARR